MDHRPRPIPELLLVASLFLAYKLGRLAVAGDVSTAYANAAHLWELQRAWGLPSEAELQQAALGHSWLLRAANVYYAGVHFPATAALLLWTYARRPDLYRWARTSLAWLTAAAFVVHVLFPLAPPRLLAMTGMVDTGHALGPAVYGNPASDVLANQYAAMPSLHVGWAAVVALVLIRATRGRWRWLWLLHPLATVAVVVVTANHYWLDAAVALLLLAAIQLLLAVAPRSLRPGATAPPVEASGRHAESLAGRGKAALSDSRPTGSATGGREAFAGAGREVFAGGGGEAFAGGGPEGFAGRGQEVPAGGTPEAFAGPRSQGAGR